jgi:hypothetical protein
LQTRDRFTLRTERPPMGRSRFISAALRAALRPGHRLLRIVGARMAISGTGFSFRDRCAISPAGRYAHAGYLRLVAAAATRPNGYAGTHCGTGTPVLSLTFVMKFLPASTSIEAANASVLSGLSTLSR